MGDKKFECDICGSVFSAKSSVYTHQKKSENCFKLQMEKLGYYKYPEDVKKITEMKKLKEEQKKTKVEQNKKEPSDKDTKKVSQPQKNQSQEDDDSDDISENDEIPLDSSSEDDVEIDEMSSSSEDEETKNSDKEDAIKFFKNMGATKFDNIKTFKKKYTTVSKEVINDGVKTEDVKTVNKPVESCKEQDLLRVNALENKLSDIMNVLVKVSDNIISLDNKITRITTDNDKKYKDIERRLKDIDTNSIIDKIEGIFGSTIENNVEISKKLLAEIDSKNETLEIIKEDIDETCDKYYEIYKKFKIIKEDMEDMVRSKRK